MWVVVCNNISDGWVSVTLNVLNNQLSVMPNHKFQLQPSKSLLELIKPFGPVQYSYGAVPPTTL
jgi:hypothetical protein